MTLATGTRLGPYEILAKLGEGGMGDVYKARDTRLDRTVAIKIVRTDFSERFEREARSISALNHPNICTLHDVGEQNGTAFLVMEFVDGAPIAGPLPLSDVIKYGVQICDALEAAHRKSIVHRDLKPANILATKSGIKLLDFGLAKLQPPAAGAPGNDATVAALTGAHMVLGTPQYMAPEQIEGRDADARTDIFALGCVLYELITGKRAFDGKTSSNVMAAVLATEPRRISELVPMTPATLEWIVQRCLEKDADARWQSARDVALQLRWVGEHPEQPPLATSGRKTLSRSGLLRGLALGIAAAGLAAVLWIWMSPRSASAPVSLSILLTADAPLLLSGVRPGIALSPDGRTVAFAALTGINDSAIFVRVLDTFEAVKVPGTEGGSGPFFSPEGKWVAFWVDGQLKKIPVGGGAPVVICEAPALRGAAWLADDTIVFSPLPTGSLMRVSAQGGAEPTVLTNLDVKKQEKTHRTPIGLPGGKAVVLVIGSDEIDTYDDARIVALDLETRQITELVKGGYAPRFSPTGHLLYVQHESVFAVPFDAATLRTSGSAVQVLKGVASLPSFGTADYDLASSGALIFAPGGNQTSREELRWIDRDGNVETMPADPREYFVLDVSRDGRRLAVTVGGANNVVYAYDIATGKFTRATSRFDVEGAVWTHNDSRITYWSGTELRAAPADSNGSDEVLMSASELAGRRLYPLSSSADGQMVSVTWPKPGKDSDVGIYSVRDDKLTPIAETRFNEFEGYISPDGKWIAYISDENGRPEVYVQASDSTGKKHMVSSGGATRVRWSLRGRELIYATAAEIGVMAVPFAPGPTPAFGKPHALFGPNAAAVLKDIRALSPAPDGSRFAALFRVPHPPLKEIRVVTNWTPER
jgi:serine/threonine-protein kinase